jgi:hypothetical protein
MVDWSNPKNAWMKPEVRQEISAFQDSQIEAEFAEQWNSIVLKKYTG